MAFDSIKAVEDPFLTASLAGLSIINSVVLNVATELNIFEIIAKASPKGVSASEIASQLATQQDPEFPRRLDRMLCLLASNSLLTCSIRPNEAFGIERLYQLSPAGKYFTNDEKTGSLSLLPTFVTQRVILDALLNLKEVLYERDTNLFEKVHGINFYQCLQRDSTTNHVFNKAMENFLRMEMNNILEKYNGFEGISVPVDVGGGVGQCLNAIISKYPSIKGVNFDLPQVIQTSPHYPGIEHVRRDMFESVPKGDAIILKGVCHNWDDEKCLKLLRNCYEALPQNGKVIIVDFIMPEEIQSNDADKFVSCMDNLVSISGGRERTKKEFENLCKGSGFSNFQAVCRVFSTLGMMEFYVN